MKSIALQNFPFLGLTLAALILFFIVFAGVVLWVNRPASRRVYQHIEKLPLD